MMQRSLRLTGAVADLGLNATWRYAFVPAGRLVEPLGDTVFIDVGGRLERGVIDHHHVTAAERSSARLVVEYPGFVHDHLVTPWIVADRIKPVRGRSWTPTIVMHTSPDFDAIVTTYLVQSIIAEGTFPAGYEELAQYADRVDSGLEQPALPLDSLQLYPLILMLQNIKAEFAHTQNTTLHQLAVLARLASIDEAAALPDDELVVKLGMHLISERNNLADNLVALRLAATLEQDIERFRDARERYRLLGLVPLPSSSHQPVGLSGAVLEACGCDQPACICNTPSIACDKIYMRLGSEASGIPSTPLTVIEKPRGKPAADGIPRHRWIISIDPAASSLGKSSAAQATLEGLGASLEWAEQARRKSLGASPLSRQGMTRFVEFPQISDPWYDGRGHQFTIVDSPKDGSVLSQHEIVTILTREEFWDPLCETAAAWHWSDNRWRPLETPSNSQGMCRLRRFLKSTAEGTKGYIIAVVKIHAGWSAARVNDAIRDFLSGTPQPVQLVCGTAHTGPCGTLVALNHQSAAAPFAHSLGALLSLHHNLSVIEQHARGQSNEFLPSSGAHCRQLRKQFINAIAEYHARPSRDGETPDERAVRLAVEEVLRIDRRREGTGELLQLLDDEEQEVSEWRLNRLGLILTLMGVMQTIIAAFDAIEASWPASTPEERSHFHAVWAYATFGITALFAVFAFTMVIPSFQRLYARVSFLKTFFPEHVAGPARTKTPE